MIRFVPFDLRHLRNNLSKHPLHRSNRFLKIILQSCQSLRIRVDFYLRIFLLCSSFPLSPFFFLLLGAVLRLDEKIEIATLLER